MKNRIRSAIGLAVSAAVEDTAGRSTDAADPTSGSAGSPEVVEEAAGAVRVPVPNSRRLAAATVHSSGAATGAPPSPPAFSHDSRSPPTLATDPVASAEAGRALVSCGAADADGTVTVSTPAGASLPEPASAAGAEDPPVAGTETSGVSTSVAGEVDGVVSGVTSGVTTGESLRLAGALVAAEPRGARVPRTSLPGAPLSSAEALAEAPESPRLL